MPLMGEKASMFQPQVSAPKQRAPVNPSSNQARERSQHREERTRSHSQPSNREALRPQTANPRADIALLKIDVPNNVPTRPSHLKHQTSQSTLSEQENGYMQTVVKQEPVPRSAYQMHGHNDDDSTEITTGEGGWDAVDYGFSGEATAIHRPVDRSTSRNYALGSIDLGPHWRQEADAGRALTGLAPKFGNQANFHRQLAASHDNDESIHGFDDGEDELSGEDLHELRNETPSRAIKAAPVKAVDPQKTKSQGRKQVHMAPQTTRAAIKPSDDRDSSPLLDSDHIAPVNIPTQPQIQQSNLARHREYKQNLPLVVPPQEPPKPEPNSNLHASKVSAYHETSEEEQMPEPKVQPPEATTKRTYEEIDYDLDELRSKKYGDLDRVPFLNDPRALDIDPAVDTNGNPMPLLQRLTNLNKLKSEDQAAVFHSLTDEENEEVGQWFVQQFQENLKKLMERRVERRKIALKYEAEAKKRETEVQAKMQDVGEELKQLRKGGGELIKDKSVGAVGGTPRKE